MPHDGQRDRSNPKQRMPQDFGGAPGQPQPLPASLVFGPDGKYDLRRCLVRRGRAGWVTGPTEIADDLTAFVSRRSCDIDEMPL